MSSKNTIAVKEAKKVLEQISQDEREQYLAHLREKYILDQKAIEAFGYDNGLEDGLKQGIEKGLEDGLKRGLEQGLEDGLKQGIEKGLEDGLKRGLEQGLEDGLKQGIEKGLQDGLKQGLKQRTIEIAKEMLKQNVDIELIVKITSLTKEEIEKINL